MIISQHNNKTQQYATLLEKISEEIDIPDWLYERAKKRYEKVGEWLGRKESTIAKYNPSIYPQGSFLLGTPNRPITEEDECDIDLVCNLDISIADVEWYELKQLVGNELKANGTYKKMLKEESRRCWTIVYSEKEPIRFHLDILPAIPNHIYTQNKNPLLKDAIFITDNVLEQFMGSNPKGYAEWFKEQMMAQKAFDYFAKAILESKRLKCEIAEVPNYAVKMPLQRVIQLLKRHRDIEYKDKSEDERENKPISIIITTLATKAYAGIQSFPNNDLYTITKTILDEMPKYITSKKNSAGKPILWVENPTDKKENFADKWEEYPERCLAFTRWLDSAQTTLKKAFEKQGIHNISESLKKAFGKSTINKAVKSFYGDGVGNYRKDGSLGTLGKNAGLLMIKNQKGIAKVPENTFYGED